MTNLQIEFSLAALVLLIIIFFSLRRNSISIRISLTWLLLPLVFILIAIFPEPINELAHWLGFETLSNFIFVVIIAVLLILCFFLTVTISKQSSTITTLIQEISILKERFSHNDKTKK